jgi:hypothetical protein
MGKGEMVGAGDRISEPQPSMKMQAVTKAKASTTPEARRVLSFER